MFPRSLFVRTLPCGLRYHYVSILQPTGQESGPLPAFPGRVLPLLSRVPVDLYAFWLAVERGGMLGRVIGGGVPASVRASRGPTTENRAEGTSCAYVSATPSVSGSLHSVVRPPRDLPLCSHGWCFPGPACRITYRLPGPPPSYTAPPLACDVTITFSDVGNRTRACTPDTGGAFTALAFASSWDIGETLSYTSSPEEV